MPLNPQKDVQIDEYNLEVEAKTLPSLMQGYHEEIERLTDEEIDLNYQIEKETAQTRIAARKVLDKPTVAAVEDTIGINASLIDLKKKRDKISKKKTYYKGVLSALDTKRSCLNNLVSLYIKDYYRDDSDDGSYRHADVVKSRTVTHDWQDEQNKQLNEAMKHRRRKQHDSEEEA